MYTCKGSVSELRTDKRYFLTPPSYSNQAHLPVAALATLTLVAPISVRARRTCPEHHTTNFETRSAFCGLKMQSGSNTLVQLGG
ncbi:uncharacterized protein PHALS_06899 [Plasmopara halstedii]|uniref:Uncharacterized protein n=1 Tax=Plasmopara halstedii TaxID=4781 RepID=A0A0P1B6C8_PLAHL|nr:uncharacterized protein PHALS_06899 [Plasmopara halstedii]CEG49117.1 hypothetical protein PHALS_06899 [Plasmopara halstedii]|eukprot:XP_024585486.1 hypothetical protein PHALS_06899 [Plasmopara halstedii]